MGSARVEKGQWRLGVGLSLLLAALVAQLAGAASSSSNVVSFSLIHRDAPSSAIRRSGAVHAALDALDMPLRDFAVAGLAMHERLMKERARRSAGRRKGGPKGKEEGVFTYGRTYHGDFYLKAKMGSPPQEIFLTLDTGSELTWAQCAPCTGDNCPHPPFFHPAKSSSYRPVLCNSSLCMESPGFKKTCGNDDSSSVSLSNSTGRCIFVVAYGDMSYELGHVSLDSLVGETSTPNRRKLPFAFGCATKAHESVEVPAAGLMGLSQGAFSFPSQLFAYQRSFPRKFAYCLPDRFRNLNSPGIIQFGGYSLPSKPSYTPLVPPYAPLGTRYYYIGIQSISVGTSTLDIPASAFAPTPNGEGGSIIDSGSERTSLAEPAYSRLVHAMKKATSHLHPFPSETAGSELCYSISSSSKELPRIPTITFHLLDGVDLELDAYSSLYVAELTAHAMTVCLAFDQSDDTMSILGNHQQQNYWVEYDIGSSRLGFLKAKCPGSHG